MNKGKVALFVALIGMVLLIASCGGGGGAFHLQKLNTA